MRLLATALLVFAACSSKNASGPTIVDAPPSDSGGGGAGGGGGGGGGDGGTTLGVNVYVLSNETPLYLAYREGTTGDWTQITPSSTGYQYTIPVTTAYEFVAVCTDGSAYYVDEEVAVPADGYNEVYCFDDSIGGGGDTTAVSGTMDQPGTVWLGGSAGSATAPWTFTIDAAASSTADLIALGSAAMLIERGLAIGAGPTQTLTPDIDLGSGSAYDVSSITVTGALGTANYNDQSATLYTDNYAGYARVDNGSNFETLTLPPQALLTSDDSLSFEFDSDDDTYGLDISSSDPTTTTYAFPPELDGITFSGNSASWTSLPAGDYTELNAYGSADIGVLAFDATATWLGSATSVAFDADSGSGWDPAWTAWTASATVSLGVLTYTSYGSTFSSVVTEAGFRSRARDRLAHERAAALRRGRH